jgi:general secretion pathway protein D
MITKTILRALKKPHALRRNAFLFVALFIVATMSAQAQRATTGTGRTGGGGGGGGGGQRVGGGGAGASTSGSRQYYSNGTVGEAIIRADPDTRRIIVITDEDTSQHISQVVTNLDRPKPQVLINVMFLEVTYRNSLDVGLEGAIRKEVAKDTTLSAQNAFNLAQEGVAPSANFPGAGLYTLAGSDYNVVLRAISAIGKTEVLSRPSILARNNQQATITVGQTLPFITNTRITDTAQTINTVQYSDIGIILRVTPFITSDNLVEMIVSPEISTLTDKTVPISTGVSAPVIAKRSADTVVVTPDGETVIIGGLMQNQKLTTDSKIPLLGDIPGLGNLFKRKQRDDTKTELMIFMTPHIITRASQLAAATARERAKAILAPKAFTPDEMHRFLEDPVPGQPQAPVLPPQPQ